MQNIRRHTALVFLLLYIGYSSCVSFFIHSHTYNGMLYFHSHPFSKKSIQDDTQPIDAHNHSLKSFFTLNQLSSILTGGTPIFAFLAIVLAFSYFLFREHVLHKSKKTFTYLFNLRAPPASILS